MSTRTFVSLFTAFAATTTAFCQVGDLTDDVRRLINSHKWGDARVGVSIYDCTGNVAIANVKADEAFTPASNMKLLTSGAALMVLGPDFVFKTKILLKDKTLIIQGDGDPSLADPEVLEKMDPKLSVGDMLGTLCGAVSKVGVDSVDSVVVDDRVFDRQYVHPSWPVDQLSRGYCAEVCGINFHANVLYVFPGPNPNGPGQPAIYSLQPAAPWIEMEVRSRTVREGNNSAWLTRDDGDNKFTLRGDVRHQSLSPIEVTYHNPATFVGRLFATELPKHSIAAKIASVRLAEDHDDFSGATVVAVVSTPLPEVLKRCNTDSANLYAESLMKRMGHAVTNDPGSWTNGPTVLRMMLTEKVGPAAAASTVITDGSGMSRENAVCPSTYTKWLSVISADKRLSQTFTDSLAEVGTGTLRKRFQGAGNKPKNHLQAKSGYINGVRTLSGYLTNQDTARQVTFSVMINGIKSDVAHTSALELHEEVVRLADKWLTQRAAAERPKIGG